MKSVKNNMEKKLAIRGHSTRGKEVIELLEMMGGKNNCDCPADDLGLCYLIDDEFDICAHYFGYDDYEDGELNIFTLEEFLEKYPFKVGDKVVYTKYGDNCDDYPDTIESMKWTGTTIEYTFNDCVTCLAKDLKMWNTEFLVNKEKSEEVGKMLCDMTLKHLHGNHLKNVLSELYEHIKTTPKEDLEREFKEIESEGWTNVGPTVEEFMDFCDKVNKKPKYPKTIEACVKLLGVDFRLDMDSYKRKLMANFYRLILCRDAYWKILGEEMGLGKPWEPDWISGKPFYCISVNANTIGKGRWYTDNKILAFPTEEIRDVFYENFKDLIEQCKELL